MMKDKAHLPIGVFDSGLGGLTALGELRRLMPNEDLIYFGDSARIPYGTKSPSVIKKFALQDARFLLSKDVKAILVACGTVSSNCISDVASETELPTVGVICAAAREASRIAREGNGRVAVLGTGATVRSGAFDRALADEGISEVYSVACPMFVPLVEYWSPDAEDVATNAVVEKYLADVAEFDPDAVILGCTHYPLLADVIAKYLPNAKLVNSGEMAAKELCDMITEAGENNIDGGSVSFYTSDDAELFRKGAEKFFGGGLDGEVAHVDIEKY